MRRSPWGIVANVLNCNIIVSEFKLKSQNHIDFWTNTLEKGMNFLIHSNYELNSTTPVLL